MRGQLALQAWLCLVIWACACGPAVAVKLRVHTTECVHQEIEQPSSLVSVVLVAGMDDDMPVFYDFTVRCTRCSVSISGISSLC